jgi:hypothetical protein
MTLGTEPEATYLNEAIPGVMALQSRTQSSPQPFLRCRDKEIQYIYCLHKKLFPKMKTPVGMALKRIS